MARNLELIDRDNWVPDDHCDSCLKCNSPFTKLRRRHHCRKCGNLVCGSCSAQRAPSHPDVRLCDTCFENHTAPLSDEVRLIEDIPSLNLDAKIPLIVRRCVEYLSSPTVLREEGLFRIPGSKTEVAHLFARFETGGDDVNLQGVLEPATVCGVFKMYLMQSGHPPFPKETSQALYSAVSGPEDLRIPTLKKQIGKLDPWVRATLEAIVRMLARVVDEPANLMTVQALGTSLGMTMFQSLSVNNAVLLLDVLLNNVEDLFA